ncbi:Asp23/Gls24 family envelope stress response protein [Streptomyces sp. NK08204]|uniref:Asp23/Gls24 family envelope stress response protein n=1 Tax=Streptomyces sp. NK08204 TaxID=2873260 RepID=UPI001CED4E94|nr:Asp23/Gls24 family envelope stress response protein [Streptomyces sp. NK08204]
MRTRPGSPGEGSGPDPPASAVALPPPAERGATVIPDRVVARIAVQAARTAQSRRAAVPPGRSAAGAPSASAAVRTGTVRLHLTMDLPYPTDIAGVCERIQQDVADRVAQLTGLRVREVTLTVRRLLTADASRRRVR